MRIPRSGIAAVAATTLLVGGAFAAPALAGTPHRADANPDVIVKAKTLSGGTTVRKGVPHSGDRFWYTENLKLGKTKIGTSFVSCSYVVGTIAECNVTWDFSFAHSGTIQGGGVLDTSPTADDSDLAITGGTGIQTGVSGDVGVSLDSATSATYTFSTVGDADQTP